MPAGAYLGIDVAIKEVLPSTDYDVAKYFEREWRLMKSALKDSPQAI
jgi:LIM domain kinase 1